MLRWKEERQGETALLIEGARRIGKSTIVEEFAKTNILRIYWWISRRQLPKSTTCSMTYLT